MAKTRKVRRGSRRLRKMKGRGFLNKARNFAASAKNYGSRGLATAKNYGSRGLATAKNYGTRGLATAKNYGTRAKTYITGGPTNGSNQMANLKQGQARKPTYERSFATKVYNTFDALRTPF